LVPHRRSRTRTDRSKARHEASHKGSQAQAAIAAGIIAVTKRHSPDVVRLVANRAAVAKYEAVDLDPSVGLQAFARLAREGILDSVEKGRVNSGPMDLTIGGRHAVQVELEGAADGVRIVYVHTSIEGSEGFVEVIAWTLPSLIDETRSLLQSISGSVRFQP
jgi:hypothetical protein